MTKNVKLSIESQGLVPCGPLLVSADRVCRRAVNKEHGALLDKLSETVSPTFEESSTGNLQGNSKLLQDVSGKMSGWRDKG